MRRLAVLCVVAAAGACSSDGVTVTRQQTIVRSLDSHLRMLNTVGELHTDVRANPWPQDPQAAAIRAAMASTVVFPRLSYVPQQPAKDAYGYRVVVAFGGWPYGGDNYCRNPNLSPQPPATDITEVTSVLCVGASVLSEAAARTARIDDPGDPRLTKLMNATVQALLAQSNRLDLRSPGIGFGIGI